MPAAGRMAAPEADPSSAADVLVVVGFESRRVAMQPGQLGHSIIDAKAIGRYMPPVFPGARADTLESLAAQLGLPVAPFVATVRACNAACRPVRFDHAVLDDCTTEGLDPPKSHRALPIDTPRFFGYTLSPGVTFRYLGL